MPNPYRSLIAYRMEPLKKFYRSLQLLIFNDLEESSDEEDEDTDGPADQAQDVEF